MHTLLRTLGAWIAGVFSGGMTVAALEVLSHQIWPPPADLDISDAAAVAAVMAQAPTGVFIALIAAWTLGAAAASGVATVIATWRRVLIGGMAGGMILAATAMNLMAIPHPTWVNIAGPAGVLGGMFVGAWLGMLRPSMPQD